MRNIKQFVENAFDLLNSKRKRWLERLIGVGILAFSLVFLFIALVRGWAQLEPHLRDISFIPLVAGQFFIVIALLLGIVMWGVIQQAVGLGLGWQECVVIHLASNVTKYAPGYAWQYLGKAYIGRKRGGSSRQVVFMVLTELVLLIIGGIFITALWGLLSDQHWHFSPVRMRWVWLLSGVFASLAAVGWNVLIPGLANGGDRLVRYPRLLWWALVVGMVGWFMFAIAAWFMSRSLYPVSLSTFPQHGVALVTSVVVGIAIIVVPGGLGVREALLATLLTGVLPFTLGVVVGMLLRISIVFWELVGFGLAFHLNRIHHMEFLS